MTELFFGTSNQGKLRELRRLVAGLPLRVISSQDLSRPLPEVVEDGATFQENAEKKAGAYARFAGTWALADDSGLCVDALGGRPGVHRKGSPTSGAARPTWRCWPWRAPTAPSTPRCGGSAAAASAASGGGRAASATIRSSSPSRTAPREPSAWPSSRRRRRTPSPTAGALSARFGRSSTSYRLTRTRGKASNSRSSAGARTAPDAPGRSAAW